MSYEFEIVVPPGQKKERLDTYLTAHVQNATRSKVQKAIKDGAVLVNGKTVRSSHPISGGEIIRVTLPKPPPQDAEPEQIPLDIVYEDDALLIVNKPAGMVVHPAHGNYHGTLVNALLFHTRALSTVNDAAIRPGIVHRLDKDTSGLLVVAKNDVVHAKLARQFARRSTIREYQALVWGVFKNQSGTIEAELGRSKSDRKKMAVVSGGKPAITTYEVIHQYPYLAHVRLKLKTGRTHQIRVHLAHVHHPVFGDPTYNGRHMIAVPGTQKQKVEVERLLAMIPRQALHAKTLGFVHPITGAEVFFDTELPADMQQVIGELEKKEREMGG